MNNINKTYRKTKRMTYLIKRWIRIAIIIGVIVCAKNSYDDYNNNDNNTVITSTTETTENTTESTITTTEDITNTYQDVTEYVVVDSTENTNDSENSNISNTEFSLSDIPEYTDSSYVEVNGNMPYFTDEEKECTDVFELYSELDSLGRCGVAYANLCEELLPTEERGEIGSVKPTGWHTVKYTIVDGNYLYNRCHLIAFCLAGENANEKNLITGTRYMNVDGMLPFEEETVRYVESSGNHVLYRVTPEFSGDNLVANGVLMEAYSVEDNGEGICFCVYCYNVQPGIVIDYATGDSYEE